MKSLNIILLSSVVTLILNFAPENSLADTAPVVGKKAAAKYFQAKNQDYNSQMPEDHAARDRGPASFVQGLNSSQHYMALGLGSFTGSSAYNWGNGSKQEDVGKWGVDLTYRLTQQSELFDQVVRVSYNEYEPLGTRSSKMSFMYGMTFPDAGSEFPLYFGLVGGPGIFFKQIGEESSLALDYQLFMGLRLFNLFENTGFFIEGGLKNHLQITSDGQFNGTYVSAGAVFTF